VLIAEMLLLVAVNDKGHVPVGSDAFVDVGLTGRSWPSWPWAGS
jgi:hypothetical protein